LSYLHREIGVHLDIKPDNILYSFTGKYKLADLGLTRLTCRRKGEDVQEGDCRYMAPELLNDYLGEDEEDMMQIEGNLNIKELIRYRKDDLTKADIFSLGATIYELMIGKELPKNGDKWREIREGKLDLSPDILMSRFSDNFISLIRKMLNPNVKERITADEILENYLITDEKM